MPGYATVDLRGEVVDEVVSRGKHLLIRTADQVIHSHLKMEGAWHVYRPGSPWRRPGHSARAVLENAQWQAVGYSLGILEVLDRAEEESAVGHLGPDLLGPDWDLDEAVGRTGADPDRPVFLALLDQRNLAGFGNEYVNEILFLMGLLPTRPVGEVARSAPGHLPWSAHARRQQVARRPVVHRQHPHRRGALGLQPRPRPLPALRHPLCAPARSATAPPPSATPSGAPPARPERHQVVAATLAFVKTISSSRSVFFMSWESSSQFCRIVHGERVPCCGSWSATRVT